MKNIKSPENLFKSFWPDTNPRIKQAMETSQQKSWEALTVLLDIQSSKPKRTFIHFFKVEYAALAVFLLLVLSVGFFINYRNQKPKEVTKVDENIISPTLTARPTVVAPAIENLEDLKPFITSKLVDELKVSKEVIDNLEEKKITLEEATQLIANTKRIDETTQYRKIETTYINADSAAGAGRLSNWGTNFSQKELPRTFITETWSNKRNRKTLVTENGKLHSFDLIKDNRYSLSYIKSDLDPEYVEKVTLDTKEKAWFEKNGVYLPGNETDLLLNLLGNDNITIEKIEQRTNGETSIILRPTYLGEGILYAPNGKIEQKYKIDNYERLFIRIKGNKLQIEKSEYYSKDKIISEEKLVTAEVIDSNGDYFHANEVSGILIREITEKGWVITKSIDEN
jgi:hypothetical protein